jgi:hypothetical protein
MESWDRTAFAAPACAENEKGSRWGALRGAAVWSFGRVGLALLIAGHASRGGAWRVTHRRSLLKRESVGFAKRLNPPRQETIARKKPGAVSRPGTLREFQFSEYSDLIIRVNGYCGFVARVAFAKSGTAAPATVDYYSPAMRLFHRMHFGIAVEIANSCATFNASENGISSLFRTHTFSVGYEKKMLVSFGLGPSVLATEA